MRNRNVKIQVWLSKKEAENLQKKARRSNISVAAYLRHLINDLVPQEAPPPDYYAMAQQLYRIGNNLNQIARHLNEWRSPYPAMAKELQDAATDLATLKFEVMKKVGDAVGNIQAYKL